MRNIAVIRRQHQMGLVMKLMEIFAPLSTGASESSVIINIIVECKIEETLYLDQFGFPLCITIEPFNQYSGSLFSVLPSIIILMWRSIDNSLLIEIDENLPEDHFEGKTSSGIRWMRQRVEDKLDQ